MRWKKRYGIAALAAVLGQSAAAQQQITVAKVVFRNPGSFAPADLETVAGVHAGSKLTLAQEQAAAQRLADTECFEDVHLESSGTPSSLTLIFVLKPVATQLLYRAVFENLVWFSPEELRTVLHRSAPLFTDRVPESGSALDAVSAGLQAALAEKGVQAEITHEFLPATSAAPEPVMAFRVERPMVMVSSVALDGVPGELAPAVKGVEAKLRATPFVAEGAPHSTQDWLLTPLLDAGYLDARVVDVRTTPGSLTRETIGVDVAGKLEPGPIYRVSAIEFDGTAVAPAEVFKAGQKLHVGDVASRENLLASELPIEAAYRKLGYMYAYVDAGATEDGAAHTVRYALKVVPGEAFTLHSVTVQGLGPGARSQFDLAWTMKPGDPYNADYVKAFLGNNTALRSLQGYAGSFQAAADADKHQVDLTVTFVPVTAQR